MAQTLKYDDYEKLLNSLVAEMNKIGENITKLSNNINTMINGDAQDQGPLWNGVHAKAFFTIAKRNLDNDIEGYKEIEEAYKKLEKRVENMLKKGLFR